MVYALRRWSDRALVSRGRRSIVMLTARRNGWSFKRDRSMFGGHFIDRSGERFYCRPLVRKAA